MSTAISTLTFCSESSETVSFGAGAAGLGVARGLGVTGLGVDSVGEADGLAVGEVGLGVPSLTEMTVWKINSFP